MHSWECVSLTLLTCVCRMVNPAVLWQHSLIIGHVSLVVLQRRVASQTDLWGRPAVMTPSHIGSLAHRLPTSQLYDQRDSSLSAWLCIGYMMYFSAGRQYFGVFQVEIPVSCKSIGCYTSMPKCRDICLVFCWCWLTKPRLIILKTSLSAKWSHQMSPQRQKRHTVLAGCE